nr:protein piccolo-like isoform X1 [Procambarus clarkii]
MRYSGLMQSERRPASLSSVANKRLRKQIVFEIGETIHSGPTLVVQEELKDEDVTTRSNCVFPGGTRKNVRILRKSRHLAEIPSSRHCTPRFSAPLCPATQPQPEHHILQTRCDVGATVHLKGSLPAALVPEALVPEIIATKASDLEATVPQVTVTAVVPEVSAAEATVPEASIAEATASEAVVEAAIPEVLVNEATVPELPLNEATVPELTVNEAAVPQDKITEAAIFQNKLTVTSVTEILPNDAIDPSNKLTDSILIKAKRNEAVCSQDKVNECDIPHDRLVESAFLEVTVNESSILQNKVTEATSPEAEISEPTDLDATLNEGILPEFIKTESALPEVEVKPVVAAEETAREAVFIEPSTPTSKISESLTLGDLTSGPTSAHPQASLPVATEINREMVRLIQEVDAKLDSFCHKRSSRASKRINSADFESVEIKSEPLSKAKRCTRTRKSSCRSEKSESEVSDSRSVADESIYFDMVDKTAKRGKPKNGEPLLDEAATHVSAKYNGDVSSELVNGTHKVKGRRISRVNSDESDNSSASRSNGNIEHNGEKVDFSLLLEISPADRKKFESKKAKIRRKTADWLLISETEQYYNEKEEIMRNKNKLDSDSESDESDEGTENHDSRSECSDESEGTENPPRGRGMGKGKHSRTTDDDDCKSCAKRIKDDPCLSKRRGRQVGSRNRKTRYDLTMLNDDEDDDDDENFFGFPVSTTIPQTNCIGSSCSSQTRCKVKGGNKHLIEASSSGKSGRKRLSDAERFLRDNREYYHFQETAERLRRSTSLGDKEKFIKVDECEGKELDKKEESKLKDISSTKKRFTCERRRRVTRSTGGIPEEPDLEEKEEEKCVEKAETRNTAKSDTRHSEKFEVKDKERERRRVSEDKRKSSEEHKRKISEDDKRKVSEEEKKKVSEEEKKKVPEEERRKLSEEKRKVSEEEKRKITEEVKRKVLEEEKRKFSEEEKRKVSEEDRRKFSEEEKRKLSEEDKRKVSEEKKKMSERDKRPVSEDKRKGPEESKRKNLEEAKKKVSEEDKRKATDQCKKKATEDDRRKNTAEEKKGPEVDKRKVNEEEMLNFVTEEQIKNQSENSNPHSTSDGNFTGGTERSMEMRDGSENELQELYFSFEGIPDQECWYQTYQRLIDGNDVNEFVYEEEPLKFVLPYEMPKEYIRDFLCYKKGLLSKKKNDLADLVRKSPRCHASTLALFSDIIPTKKVKGSKVTKPIPVKVDEVSSDGTSTPGAEFMRMQPPESFESTEELAILALHIEHVLKSETSYEEKSVCSPNIDKLKDSEEPDLKKTPPKKRGKKKRLTTGSKFDKGPSIAKELKLFESPLAHEVDPFFIAGLCDEVKDYLTPENILAREASEVIEDACFCVCTDRASCDEFSSADDNTEASSECVSLCDSETIDGSVVSEPKRCRSGKKRRKNLTGWPKTQKKKKSVPSHTSDDNDSAIGCEDLEPKKQGHWKKHDDFSFLEQTTTQKLAALAACDRRASPRKKASVLYMDTWPVRFRTQK